MITPQDGESRTRLTLGWRRALVTISSACAAALAFLHLLWPALAEAASALTVIAAIVIICCLWLLGDTIRPWMGGDAVGPEERAHADAAVRRSYGVLFALAIGVLLYLQLAEARPRWIPDEAHHAVAILWTFVGLTVLLPLAIAAWTEPDGEAGIRTVGPVRLTRSRFSGASAGMYITGAGMLGFSIPFLIVGSGALRIGPGALADAVVLIGMAVVAAAVVAIVRAALAERRGGGHGHER